VSARCPSRVRAPSPTFESPKWTPFLDLFGALSCIITCVLSCGFDRWDLKIVGILLPYSEMKTTSCLAPFLAHPSSPLGLITTPCSVPLRSFSFFSPVSPWPSWRNKISRLRSCSHGPNITAMRTSGIGTFLVSALFSCQRAPGVQHFPDAGATFSLVPPLLS
jgi:hypothetical protein